MGIVSVSMDLIESNMWMNCSGNGRTAVMDIFVNPADLTHHQSTCCQYRGVSSFGQCIRKSQVAPLVSFAVLARRGVLASQIRAKRCFSPPWRRPVELGVAPFFGHCLGTCSPTSRHKIQSKLRQSLISWRIKGEVELTTQKTGNWRYEQILVEWQFMCFFLVISVDGDTKSPEFNDSIWGFNDVW